MRKRLDGTWQQRGTEKTLLQKMWEWAEENLSIDEIKKLLLDRDRNRRPAWHVAAEMGHLDVLQKLWEWAKENLTTVEINNKLLLATNKEGRTAWKMAAMKAK